MNQNFDTLPTTQDAVNELLGRLFGFNETRTVKVHPGTLTTMIKNDMVDWEKVDGMMIPVSLGETIITDVSEPLITDDLEIFEYILRLQGYIADPADEPGCGCPPGQCLAQEPEGDAAEPELIEGEAFEPYEIPVVDAAWAPAPSKREILAGIGRSIENFSTATNELLAQVDLLRDDG